MTISQEKRLAIIAALAAWRRQSKDKRPTNTALARRLNVAPHLLRTIAKSSLRRQKTRINERKRIKDISPLHRNSATIKSRTFAPSTVRRIRRNVRLPRKKAILIRRAQRLGESHPWNITELKVA